MLIQIGKFSNFEIYKAIVLGYISEDFDNAQIPFHDFYHQVKVKMVIVLTSTFHIQSTTYYTAQFS